MSWGWVTITAIGAIAVAGGGGLVWNAHANRTKLIRRLAEQVEVLRREATIAKTYRPLTAGDSVMEVEWTAYEQAEREFALSGFSALGYFEERRADAGPVRLLSLFASAERTIDAFFASMKQPRRQVMCLFSESVDGRFICTARGWPEAGVAWAPTDRRVRVPWETPLPEVLKMHRDAIADIDPVPRGSNDPDAGPWRRLQKHLLGWRAMQNAEELLEADLHCVLGGRYAELQKPLRKALLNLTAMGSE